ncbi:MAG: sigma-70 family RNA polymerase sigma factor [Actinomycetota bacterium]|nr:sigma-70 family RNA polymerase sigma factor [Actinomycetota bacterium]
MTEMAQRMEDPQVLGVPAGSLEDKELTLAFQQGDKGAYQAIYDRYSDRVHRVCRRMLANPQDAQEAAQESFLRVYQALGRFNGRYQLGAWITRIATNVCLDHLRSRARRPQDVAPLEVVDLDDERHLTNDDPEFLVIRNAEGRRVRKVLAQLPPLHRAAIVLRDFEGLSYGEVAVALQLSECQVKALIHRARQNFKRTWTPVSLFMPWRLVTRFREVDGTARDHVAQAVTTTAQVAPSCTSALQQCGQYVAERVAPIFTAAVIGAAAGGAAVAGTGTPAAPRAEIASAEAASQEAGASAVLGTRVGRKVADPASLEKAEQAKDDSAELLSQEPQPAPAAPPAPQPTPSASPTAAPVASPTPQPSDPPTEPSKTEKPVREPFAASLGFDRYGTPPAVVPSSNRTWVDCDPVVMKQRLESVFSDGEKSYPAVFSLSADSSSATIALSIWKDGREIYYTGSGSLSGGSREGSDLTLQFTGTYRTGDQEAQDSLGLPGSGSFVASLGIDCGLSELVSESVTFSS